MRRYLPIASAAALVLLVAACGGGGDGGATAGPGVTTESPTAGAKTTTQQAPGQTAPAGGGGGEAKLPDDPCALAPGDAVRTVIKSPLPPRPGPREEPQPGVATIVCRWQGDQTSVPPESMILAITSIPAEARKSARDGLSAIVRSGQGKEVSGLGEVAVSSASQQQSVVRVVVKGLTVELGYSQRVERGATGPGSAEKEQALIDLARAIVSKL